MDIRFLEGARAYEFLNCGVAGEAWDALCARCPWSQTHQKRDFIATWYDVYRQVYDPIIITHEPKGGRLEALLPLARNRRTGGLVPAGHWDAEYQGWLTSPEHQAIFPAVALAEVNRRYPHRNLVFRYLSPGTPMEWLSEDRAELRCELRTWPRPMVSIPNDKMVASCHKRSNRNRINRLHRMGEVRFKRLNDVEELKSIIDCVAAYSDFRHGAIHGVFPFRRDPLRREFLLRLFNTGLLHGTTFQAGDVLLSAQLNIGIAGQLVLHVVTHTPIHPRLSPGTLHMLQLVRAIGEEGFQWLDLTPGGDAYKDNYADRYDQADVLTVFGSRRKQFMHRLQVGSEELVRKALKAVHLQPAAVRQSYRGIRGLGAWRLSAKLLRGAGRTIFQRAEYHVYSVEMAKARFSPPSTVVGKNVVGDLLKHAPLGNWGSERAFLSYAMGRFAEDASVYTICDKKRLLQFGWLAEQSERTPSCPACDSFRLPANSACLFEFHAAHGADVRHLAEQILRQMLCDLRAAGTHRVFACVRAENRHLGRALQDFGFMHISSSFQRIDFGRVRRWRVWKECDISEKLAISAAADASQAVASKSKKDCREEENGSCEETPDAKTKETTRRSVSTTATSDDR